MHLELTASGLETLPPGISREGYRIVQEALTNAARHGGTGPVTLRLSAGDELVIEVVNPLPAAPRPGGGGRGVTGIRERVGLLGGTVRAGADGDMWRVRTALPRARR